MHGYLMVLFNHMQTLKRDFYDVFADDEYFFLDHETKISKVAPDSWKKGQISSFVVYLRVKFFVDDITFVL